MTKKLSETQQEVIDLMVDGWELCLMHGLNSYACLREDGGDTKPVNASTLGALVNRGLVVVNKEGFPTSTYRLLTPEERLVDTGKLSKKDLGILDEFDEWAQSWGWERDQGNGSSVDTAEKHYNSARKAMVDLLETKNRKIAESEGNNNG